MPTLLIEFPTGVPEGLCCLGGDRVPEVCAAAGAELKVRAEWKNTHKVNEGDRDRTGGE